MKLLRHYGIGGKGERLPWYYGFAYESFDRFSSVFAPIPLNLIIQFWRRMKYRRSLRGKSRNGAKHNLFYPWFV